MPLLFYRINILLLYVIFIFYVIFHSLVYSPLLFGMRMLGLHDHVGRVADRTILKLYRTVFTWLHCEVRVEGAEHIPKDKAFIVMVNHQSKFDIPLLGGYLGKPMGFLAKRELFRIPGFSFWMRQSGCMPLDRKDVAGGAAAMEEWARDLRSHQRGLIVFPEGTRSKDPGGAIQSFKQGSLRIASENDLPILPISLDGTRFFDQINLLHETRRGGRYVRMKIFPLKNVQVNSAPERKAFMAELRDVIIAGRESILVRWPTST